MKLARQPNAFIGALGTALCHDRLSGRGINNAPKFYFVEGETGMSY